VPPEGPDWKSFSLRIPESDVLQIPGFLEECEASAPGMAHLARREWDEWFSLECSFHRIVEWCLAIQKSRTTSETWLKWTVAPQVITARFARPYVSRFLRGFGAK